jgi:hypothetical protein
MSKSTLVRTKLESGPTAFDHFNNFVPNPIQGEPMKVASDVVLPQLEVKGSTMAYREAGNPEAPVALFLHGNPTSSYIWRNVMISLGLANLENRISSIGLPIMFATSMRSSKRRELGRLTS